MKRLVTKFKYFVNVLFIMSLVSCATTEDMAGEENIDEISVVDGSNQELDGIEPEVEGLEDAQDVESLSEGLEQASDILEGGEAVEPEMEEVASESFSAESYELTDSQEPTSEIENMNLGAGSDLEDQQALASEMDTVGSIENVEPAVQEASSLVGGSDSYIVQPGDSLSKIARFVYGDTSKWRELARDNGIAGTRIFPGDVLKVRSDESSAYASAISKMTKQTVTVKAGDSLASIAQVVLGDSVYWKVLYQYNKDKISNPNRIFVGQVLVYYKKADLRAALDGIHKKPTKATAH